MKLSLLVELFLLGGHVNSEDLLHFSRQGFLDVFLDTPQQERLQNFVQALIAVVPAFTMLILKILPGLKPDGKSSQKHKWMLFHHPK